MTNKKKGLLWIICPIIALPILLAVYGIFEILLNVNGSATGVMPFVATIVSFTFPFLTAISVIMIFVGVGIGIYYLNKKEKLSIK